MIHLGTLNPYFNNISSGPYYTGYNASTSGAIYTRFGNWGFFPIFKNTTGEIIKLDSLTLGTSIYNGGAIGKLFFADLGSNLFSTARATPQSSAFSIPGGTTCQNITVALTNTVVVNPNSYFLLGVKICKIDNRNSYINIACDWLKTKQNAFYTSRDITTGIDEVFDTVRVDASRSPWDKRVPHMYVSYSKYMIKPILSSSIIDLTQGQTGSITVSGYNDWSIKSISNSERVKAYRVGDTLQIKAQYFDSSNDIDNASEIIINGLNSSVKISVNIKMPDITNCVFSNNIIRPLETVSLISRTSDGLTPIIENIVDNSNKLSTNGSSITCAAVTEPSSGWAGVASGSYAAEITLRHPLNKLIIRKFSSASILQVKHYSPSDINVTFSSYDIFNIEGIKVYVTDTTQVVGGSRLKNYSHSFTYVDNTLILLNNITSGSRIVSAYLVNDYVVAKNITIFIRRFIPLSVTPNNNDVRLALFCYKESDRIRLSPYGYPIRLMYPSTYGAISRNGISRRDIVIEKLSFGYDDGTGNHIILDEQYKNNIFWVSELLNAFPSTEKDYLLVFGLPDFTLLNNTLLNTNDLDSQLQIQFTVSYFNDATGKEDDTVVTIKFEKYLNRIITFETNKYINGVDIPGSLFKKPANKAIKDTVLATFDCGINNLLLPARGILVNYFNRGVSQSQLIDATRYSHVSNTVDKTLVESLLSYINSLNNAVNIDSSLRILSSVRSKIAIGKYIMWDDNLDYTSDGQLNITDTVYTASPWKELYNSIKNIQYMKKYRICYKDSDIAYGLKYRVGSTDYDIMAWR